MPVFSVPVRNIKLVLRGAFDGTRQECKKHMAEQIMNLLRRVEVGVANGKTLPQACKKPRSLNRRTTGGAGSMAG